MNQLKDTQHNDTKDNSMSAILIHNIILSVVKCLYAEYVMLSVSMLSLNLNVLMLRIIMQSCLS
jgi:hypothetical protein